MKYIVVILLSLFSISSIAQNYPDPPTVQGSPNTKLKNKGGFQVDSTFLPPRYTDTLSANNKRTALNGGSQIIVGDKIYLRSEDATRWILQGTSNNPCNGTEWLTGSVTYSGTGLVYDAINSTYFIGCNYYTAAATTLTISAADPTYPRIDIIVADTTGNFVILTGTPSDNPVAPSVNPLSQIYVTFVYVPAGSLVPQCTTATTVYNENVEWTGASNVSGINFAYATNPYSGVVSTYIPNAVDGQYVSYQNGTVLDITDYQFLKFYIRLNAASATDPSNFLTISFFNGASQSTQDFYVGTGTYGFDGSVIGSYQLVVIPVYNIVFSSSSFDKVNIYINGAPTSFQVDKMYLLSCASTPPTQGTAWVLGGNYTNGVRPNTIGTKDKSDFPIITTDVERLVISQDGITESSDTTHKVLLWDSTTHRVYWTYQPTIYSGTPCLYFIDSIGKRWIIDTCSGGGSGYAVDTTAWHKTGDAGTVAGTNFIGTTDDVDLVFKRNGVESGRLTTSDTHFGLSAGAASSTASSTAVGTNALASVTGSSKLNVGIGTSAGENVTTGMRNFIGGSSSALTLVTGGFNTLSGYQSDVAASNTDSSGAFGYKAVASSHQFALSPYFTEIKATGITGASNAGHALITDGAGIATFQSVTPSDSLTPYIKGGASYSIVNRDASNTISSTGGNSTIASASGSTMHGNNSFIASEQTTIEADCEAIAAVSGSTHYVQGSTDCLVGGTATTVFNSGTSINFSLGGEITNCESCAVIGSSGGRLGSIIGSATSVYNSGIYSGQGGIIDSASNNSVIIGGLTNTIGTGSVNSAIIGGTISNISLGKDNVILLGKSGYTATRSNTTYVDSLDVSGKVTGDLSGGTGLPISTGVSGLGSNVATFLATPSSANLASAVTDETGSGVAVFGTSPTFTTDLTSPKVIGGTGTTSTLTLQSTSGVGTTNADIIFKVGNNGATEGMRIANSGAITLGGALSSVYNGTYNNMTLTAGLTVPKTITAGGTTGAQTINKISGAVNFAAGASTLVVTNSTVSSTSLVFVQVYGTDATATSARVTLGSGSFTITLNAAATAETKVGFFVTN